MCLPIRERSYCGDNSSQGPLIKILVFVVIILSFAVTYLFIQTHQLNDALHKLQLHDASVQNGQHHNVQVQELIKTLEQSAPDIYVSKILSYKLLLCICFTSFGNNNNIEIVIVFAERLWTEKREKKR